MAAVLLGADTWYTYELKGFESLAPADRPSVQIKPVRYDEMQRYMRIVTKQVIDNKNSNIEDPCLTYDIQNRQILEHVKNPKNLAYINDEGEETLITTAAELMKHLTNDSISEIIKEMEHGSSLSEKQKKT